MKLSDAGLYALALHEGIVPGPYLDSVGVWTYGIGVTAAAGGVDPAKMPRGMPADLDKAVALAIEMFRDVAAKYEAAVAKAVTVPLKQHQFDALVSFHYNTGAIGRATLTKKLNAGDYAGAGQGFMSWLKPASLRARREAERDLFLHGTYPGGSVPVWGVTDAGRVIWKPVRRLSMPQFLALASSPVAANPAPETVTKPRSLLAALIALLTRR